MTDKHEDMRIETLGEREPVDQANRQRTWARLELESYKEAKKNISHLQDKIVRLRAKSKQLSRPLSPDRVQTQADQHSAEELLCTLMDLSERYRRLQVKNERLCLSIDLRISELENPMHQRILRDYYLYDQRLLDIAIMEGYCYRSIKVKFGNALESYGQKFAPNCP